MCTKLSWAAIVILKLSIWNMLRKKKSKLVSGEHRYFLRYCSGDKLYMNTLLSEINTNIVQRWQDKFIQRRIWTKNFFFQRIHRSYLLIVRKIMRKNVFTRKILRRPAEAIEGGSAASGRSRTVWSRWSYVASAWNMLCYCLTKTDIEILRRRTIPSGEFHVSHTVSGSSATVFGNFHRYSTISSSRCRK